MNKREKYLITGFSGFVSKHFIDYLETNKIEADIIGIDVNTEISFTYSNLTHVKCTFEKIDLLNKIDVEKIIKKCK